ncbi:MAG: serine/threonine protein kinase [Myxococcota bacterium]|nr:serine/threonine protein kinase [Myxococcota bacterium]MDW8361637.1 serine/threonine-protein kinase [Myxococcales bacterium]
MEDQPGTLVAGRYELVELAGRGGMATVWRAVARGAAGFERTVALKRIHEALLRDAELVAMFVEEARVGSRLQHPNIVQVLDFGSDGRGYFLVMEWVEGIDLSRWVRAYVEHGEPTPWWIVASIGIELLRALAAAHAHLDDAGRPAPVIHRDVDPHNVLLSVGGTVKLTDFGLARAMDRARMTVPGIVKGKFGYLAPETTFGHPPTVASDVYAAGIVLWEALAGRRLFDGASDMDVLLACRQAHVPAIRSLRPDVPDALETAIHILLSRHPAHRPASADEAARMLADVLRLQPVRADATEIARSVALARSRVPRGPHALLRPPREAIADLLRPPPRSGATPATAPHARPALLVVPSEPAIDVGVIPLTRRKDE